MGESALASVLDAIARLLPSLVGTVIGGGVTLLATRMTIRHQNDLEDKKRKAALDDDQRRFERENLSRLQEAIQRSMRVTARCYTQLLKLAKAGRSGSEWAVGHDDFEAQRQSLEDILLLTARLSGNELNDAMTMFREKTRRVTLESRSEAELHAAVGDLMKHYDACMALVGERLRKCIGGGDR